MTKSEAASILGRLGGLKGGKSKSKAKVAAARENGKKGGWPKGKKRKRVTVKIDGAAELWKALRQAAEGLNQPEAKVKKRKGKHGKP